MESIERWYRRYLCINAHGAALTLLGLTTDADIGKPIPRYNGGSPIESRILVPIKVPAYGTAMEDSTRSLHHCDSQIE